VDDEVRRLLIDELEKQRTTLAGEAPFEAKRRALHSLKGSFGVADERNVSEALGRMERRLVSGDASAIPEALAAIESAAAALREGRAIPARAWPEPPDDLVPRPPDAGLAVGYAESVHDRLSRIDEALSPEEPDDQAWLAAYREIHTIKGSALAVGDELMAWFCHGLEEHLKSVRSVPGNPRKWLDEVARYRTVMAEILDSPEHGLATLRLLAGAAPASVRPPIETPLPLPPKRPSLEYVEAGSESRALADDSVRVATATLERLFERAAQLAQIGGPIGSNAYALERSIQRANDVQRSLREALRMIGPPRPWGAPAAAIERVESGAAALASIAAALEKASDQLQRTAARVSREGAGMQAAVTSMRTTLASRLIEPIAASTAAQARREGKEVAVDVAGGDTPIDRRLAQALADPLTQHARNAIAHGLETPEERAARGKDPRGRVELRAGLRAGSLVIEVTDDGAGVDTEGVRRWAVESGTVAPDIAATLPDRTLLSMLFIPGFTTRKRADLLAGRGVGLDLTLAAVHRLGGTIHLSSEEGRGLTATVVVPAEGALVKVLWVEAAGVVFALPLLHTGRVWRAFDAASPVAALAELVPAAMLPLSAGVTLPPPALAIEIVDPFTEQPGAASACIGVDAIGAVEEVALRALAPIVRLNGPFASAILWGDEIRLSLDPDALLSHARR
jgi:two-component system chemotaxis sensor kinase CheA